MKLRHTLIIVPVAMLALLVLASIGYEYKAQKRSAELYEKVSRSAPKGASRQQVEASLKAEGLPFGYSSPSNSIVSPWIPVGRFRLLWETQFYFQIEFNEMGQVANFRTERFNEGL